MIFLDNNSTTKTDPRVLEKMMPYFIDKFGNSSTSSHKYGWEASDAIENSREKISKVLNCSTDELIFTSGATESNNLAICGLKNNNLNIITSNIEHKAVLDICESIDNKKQGKIKIAQCDSEGIIHHSYIKNLLDDSTLLVSIMHVNNEIGTIQPIKKIGELCKKNDVIFHVDAAQSFGKIPIDVKDMNIDLLSISSHKIYGPKGIGALYINNKINKKINPIIWGGGQEKGFRPGTLPTPLIVGFGEASEISNKEMAMESKKILSMRQKITKKIINAFSDTVINGSLKHRISGNINLTFPFLNGMSIINSIPEIAISNGSACTSSSSKPSHVLTAIGHNKKNCISSCRIGIGRFNNNQEIDIAAEAIIKAIKVKL